MHEATRQLHSARMIWVGVILCALCVAYCYLLDHVVFSSAHFSPIFRFLLTAYDRQTAWIGLIVCLLAAAWHRPAPSLRLVDFLGRNPGRVALASVVLYSLGTLSVYQNYPLSMDEYASIFQAKIFASGQAYARLPRDLVDWLVVRGFNGEFLAASRETGRAIGQYWPGFALLLTPFQYFNVPWACNASLSALAIYLVFWITKEITGDRRAAGWALLFMLASGAFVAEGLSYYSMQAHLAANLLFVALLIRPSRYRAFGAGLVGSLALILHNPVPHLLFAIPWIAATGLRRERRCDLLPLLLGYLPGAIIGVSWLIFRSDIASGAHDAAVFQGAAAGIFVWPDATLLNMRAAALVKMWVWAAPGLFLFAALGRVRRRDSLAVRLLAQSAILTFTAYIFVRFDQGHGWGYRYFHSAWGAIPILAGVAMSVAPEGPSQQHGSRLESFAGAAAILSFLILLPLQLYQIHQFISSHLAQLSPEHRPGNNIYFIHPRGGFYVADMVQIDPELRDRDLKLVSRGPIIDTQLVKRNWPSAVKFAGTAAADQWYLGPEDERAPIPGAPGQRHWVFTQIPSLPSAAGR
jgi:hypothetical protein